MEKVTYRMMSTEHPMFQNRHTRIYSLSPGLQRGELLSEVEVPNDSVLCNGCNENQAPGFVYAVYINENLHDVYCEACLHKYFPGATR